MIEITERHYDNYAKISLNDYLFIQRLNES